ncbi:MAG: 30S ribosome-binding factor RbfA [Terriglobales bacterium]
MQNPGAKYHRERMGEAMREEITALVEGELGDPRIGLVSVSELHLAPDGRSAHVFVVVDGDDKAATESLEGLMAARNYIRRELVRRLRLRQAPELFFSLDRSQQYGARIDELLQRINKRKA